MQILNSENFPHIKSLAVMLDPSRGRKSVFVHEVIVRALDEMQLLGPQIENRLEKRIRVWRALAA